jgi:type III pantothenate kinase
MLLAIDVGNSEITSSLWDQDRWLYHWRLPSKPDEPELFYGIKMRDLFLEVSVDPPAVTQIVLSSVVPGLTGKIKNVVTSLFDKNPVILGPELYEKLPIGVLNPYEIGSDLVANAMAAFARFRRTCIVVDFGTALTFTTISADGNILGVSIAPGLKTAIRALSQNTAKLFDVPLEMPPSALGHNTVTAIQSGILLGYVGLVKNIVENIRAELKVDCFVVATGGLSAVITPLHKFFNAVEPRLTLDGLRLIGELVEK